MIILLQTKYDKFIKIIPGVKYYYFDFKKILNVSLKKYDTKIID